MINSTEIGQESQAVWQADADILSGLEIPLPDELAAEEASITFDQGVLICVESRD